MKRIQRFRDLQRIVMPGFIFKDHVLEDEEPHREHNSDASTTPCDISITVPEDIILFMPSDLTASKRRRYCCPGLATLEDRLRYAEASDALEEVRHQLRTRYLANKAKIENVTGQIKNTRAREVQHRIDDNVRIAELRYNRAREAYRKLHGPGDWEQTLQVLHSADVRALNERQLNAQEILEQTRLRARLGTTPILVEDGRRVVQPASLGEGHRRPSWIWMTGMNAESADDPLTLQGMSAFISKLLY